MLILPHMETVPVTFSPAKDKSEPNKQKYLGIMMELCIELKGKHRASKMLIDTVVSKVKNVLEECISNLSLNEISWNYS